MPAVLANNKYIEMILGATSYWEVITYCLKERQIGICEVAEEKSELFFRLAL